MEKFVYKTKSANQEIISREWYVVDAENAVVGRLASKIALLLTGKRKPYYTPHLNTGDNVIVINAEKIKFTGNKFLEKEYVRHTGYPGGQRKQTPRETMAKYPPRIIEHAVKGMLPKTKLGAEMFRHLYVYEGTQHPHAAQNPKEININNIK